MLKYRRRKAPARKTRTTKKSKKVATLSKPMKRAIQRVVEQRTPDRTVRKQSQPTSGQLSRIVTGPINAYGSDTSSFQPIIPNVSQGVEGDTRRGDKIRVKSCYMDIILATVNTSNDSTDFYARVLLTTDRSIKSYAVAQNPGATPPVHYGELLDYGGGISQQFVQRPQDLLLPVNKEQFVVHYDNLIHFQKTQGLSWNPTQAPGSQISNNAYSSWRARIKIPLPKILYYDEVLDVQPSNAAPMFSIGLATVDNTIPYGGALGYTYVVNMVFEDA